MYFKKKKHHLNDNKYEERNSFPYGETIAHDKRYLYFIGTKKQNHKNKFRNIILYP